MNEANTANTLTIGMILAAIVLILIGMRETLRKNKHVEQSATLPPQAPTSDVVPFGPDEVLPTEVFSEIVSWQVSDVLVACYWYDNEHEVK